MRLGVFLPTGNDGWILSRNSPHYMPTFDLNKSIVSRAEAFGLSIGLGMLTFRGYGGETEHWDYTSEPLTQTAALLAATTSMQIFATCGVLALHPAMVARMAATIDDVAPGRFGLNIVTGWHRAEYAQMGMWPGDNWFQTRYDYATEWASIFRDLTDTGHTDFKGRYIEVSDCKMGFRPRGGIKIAAAGQSGKGREFAGRFADYNFTSAIDRSSIEAANSQIRASTSRDVRVLSQRMVILDDTDDLAKKRVDYYEDGADLGAIATLKGENDLDPTHADRLRMRGDRLAIDGGNMANLYAGSPKTVARKINELASIGGLEGLLFSFDDFVEGLDRFGTEVVPLLDFDISAGGGPVRSA
ncbi:LLM class flavin-dependent oxidoreductase [Gordonia sp. DT219]|uniref:LLM class flavin-dependent oxidoreductase n=1 Tax=Gordonia sp. DT219 TaxID=3416658 RepID=UPI003CEBEE45